jgi:hypothetical protein
MRVFGLALAGVLALNVPMAAHALPLGSNLGQLHRAQSPVSSKCGWLRLGLAPRPRALEPMAGRLGSAALRAEPRRWRLGRLLQWLGRSLSGLGRLRRWARSQRGLA